MIEAIFILSICIAVGIGIACYQLYELRMEIRYKLSPRLDRVDGKLEELAEVNSMAQIMSQAPVKSDRTAWDD